MLPAQDVVAWGNVVPWADQRQVEQDLVISRALVEIFSEEMLRDAVRFRGVTALNKLHFPAPLRYSEDIDGVRTARGPIGPILGQLRAVLEPWLGRARFNQSPVAPKLRFRAEAEDGSGVPIRLFGRYLDRSGQTISRAQAQERMFSKLARPRILFDIRPLLPAAQAAALTEESTAESFRRVFATLVDRLPGKPWERTSAMKEKFGIPW